MTSPADRPVAFYDLAAESFPFRIRYLDALPGKVMDEQIVHSRGAVEVPARPYPTAVEITYPGGDQITSYPDGREQRRRALDWDPRPG